MSKLLKALAALAAVLAIGPALGEPVRLPELDQFVVDVPGTSATGSVFLPMQQAQTFTVGITGTLSSVSVLLNRSRNSVTHDLNFILGEASSGAPSDDPRDRLAQVTLSASAVPVGTHEYVSFDLTPFDIRVHNNQQLFFALQSDEPRLDGFESYGTVGTIGGYGGGGAFMKLSSGPPFFDDDTWKKAMGIGSLDWFFQSYVIPRRVPEPTTVALVGIGLLGLVTTRRRRVASAPQ